MSASNHQEEPYEEEAEMLDPNDAAEEIADDSDAAMDSGDDEVPEGEGGDEIMEELFLQNDSAAHFDQHPDSIFCIAQHPLQHNIIATGGSAGEDIDEGCGWVFDSTPLEEGPVLPASYRSDGGADANGGRGEGRKGLEAVFKLEGHTDSINGLVFTLPAGEFLISAGLDGALQAYAVDGKGVWGKVARAQEVEEINWLVACPAAEFANTVAIGASDGSVWVYVVEGGELVLLQSYFLHTGSCTAGAWSADGKLLGTVSDDGSLYVWDVFGEAAAQGLTQGESGQTIVGLTALDQRFAVEGGLFSVAIAPSGAFVVVGGAGGNIKVIGLPRLGVEGAGKGGEGAKAKGKGGRLQGAKASNSGQSGQILADLSAQGDNIETLAFSPAPLTLLAAGSVDGSIALFDYAHRWAVRRHIKEAHEDYAVVKVEFVKGGEGSNKGWLLTSCGMDGVVRRWDTRGGTGLANSGFVGEWKGHRGEGEGGGVLGFVQGNGERVVTAGDDGVSLVFDTTS